MAFKQFVKDLGDDPAAHTPESTEPFRRRGILTGMLIFLVAAAISSFGWWYNQDPEVLSPLTSLTTFNFIAHLVPSSSPKIVYGFLPYWNMDEAVIQPELTHLAYFSLTVQGDGSIITREAEGGLEPGYRQLGSDRFLELSLLSKTQQTEVELVLTQFNNDDIVSLLNSDQAREKLFTSLDSILLAYPVSGINIDIEYTGEVTDSLRQRLTILVAELRQHLNRKYADVQLSIDMYASAASKYSLWDIPTIGKEVDYIVIMAYDFHQRSSAQAGPVAPLFGGKEYWDSDINQYLAAFVKTVPKEKLLLGIPFYGYEWQTTTREAQAHTFPNTGSTASYQRVQEILSKKDELKVQEQWNEQALSPYISYQEDGETFVIYYENSKSLSYKLEYVNQLDLAGIAIWALGYEGNNRELWDVINRKLGSN